MSVTVSDLLDDAVTSAARLVHSHPHPESFSYPRLHEIPQTDLTFHVSGRVQVFADPRRRIEAKQLVGMMQDFGPGARSEITAPLSLLQQDGGLAGPISEYPVQSPVRLDGRSQRFHAEYMHGRDQPGQWSLDTGMNPHRRRMDAVRILSYSN